MSDPESLALSRGLLKMAIESVREHFPEVRVRDDAWVYHFHRDQWEFHGPEKFYWHGSADNAYEARYPRVDCLAQAQGN